MGRGTNGRRGTNRISPRTSPAFIKLDPPSEDVRRLWGEFFGIIRDLPEEGWVLVGGLMVEVIAAKYDVATTRATEDIDILADSRKRPSFTEKIAGILDGLGFNLINQTINGSKTTGFRFERNSAVIDILAPDGLKEENPAITIENSESISIPGGTAALHDNERVSLEIDGIGTAAMQIPTLRAAILLKSRSIVKTVALKTDRIF